MQHHFINTTVTLTAVHFLAKFGTAHTFFSFYTLFGHYFVNGQTGGQHSSFSKIPPLLLVNDLYIQKSITSFHQEGYWKHGFDRSSMIHVLIHKIMRVRLPRGSDGKFRWHNQYLQCMCFSPYVWRSKWITENALKFILGRPNQIAPKATIALDKEILVHEHTIAWAWCHAVNVPNILSSGNQT